MPERVDQHVSMDGEPTAKNWNDALAKFSEWWSRLYETVRFGKSGGGLFYPTEGTILQPSYTFKNFPTNGLRVEEGKELLSYEEREQGELVGSNFAASFVKTSDQSCTNAAHTYVEWESVQFDIPGGMYRTADPGSLGATVTVMGIPVDGLYFVATSIGMDTFSAAGAFTKRFLVTLQRWDSTDTAVGAGAGAARREIYGQVSIPPMVSFGSTFWCDKDDYFTVSVYHTNGAAVNILSHKAIIGAKRIG